VVVQKISNFATVKSNEMLLGTFVCNEQVINVRNFPSELQALT